MAIMMETSHDINGWTAQEASRWSKIPYRPLLRMFQRGEAPCIPLGDPQEQNMGRGRKKRRRACARYLVPKAAFINWFESIQPTGSRRRVAWPRPVIR